jgi:hypothetical protein
MNNTANDYTVVFKHLEEAKKDTNYTILENAMNATKQLQDPIEKLKEIVMDKEACSYNIVTRT